MIDGELKCWGGASNNGWAFEVVLFRGTPTGEIRFARDGVPTFTHPIGLEEIAMFYAERWDLVETLMNELIEAHEEHL